MPRDRHSYLWDARRSGERVERFVAGRSWDSYEGDDLLSSAVERQFKIIGEALRKLERTDPAGAARIPELRRIIGVRNTLAEPQEVAMLPLAQGQRSKGRPKAISR